jgi:hypothetical protein
MANTAYGPEWARTQVVGHNLPEPAMTHRLIAALSPYQGRFEEVDIHLERLRDTLPQRGKRVREFSYD